MAVCSRCGEENPERARFCLACGTPLETARAPLEVRKTVTVLFCDVAGSTRISERLDPESLRRVMTRYFEAASSACERHGGTVEKFIGDAVMAVFGIPVLHEDDALRAARAALELRETLAFLNEQLDREWGVRIEIRTGVDTGEVVAGDPSAGQRLVTGAPVVHAKRLEESAGSGEILLGRVTMRLLGDAVRAELLPPLRIKGRDDPIEAYRLLGLAGEPSRLGRLGSALVGRSFELEQLERTFERAVAERACRLFTVLGAAGIGKTRLSSELIEALGGRARVVRGRCLPYGEGITFWPLVEVIGRLAGLAPGAPVDEAPARIGALLEGEEDAERIREGVAAALGLGARQVRTEETFWAVRKLLEAAARDRPLLVVLDDIHWAEPTLLDLIEYLAGWSREQPILLCCLARPDLLDVRPSLGAPRPNATTILLEPLGEAESAALIENLLGRADVAEEARARIAEAAEGNPLFVEEMLRMLIDEGLLREEDGRWEPVADLTAATVPPTIHALLAARLDRLGEGERAVVQRAAVVGQEFWWGAVADLSPDDLRAEVGTHLQTLVRKELIRPGPSSFAGEDGFRFGHGLIRDAAYSSVPKELRADLHERFAAWLERRAAEDGIVGHHLEQAFRNRESLGPVDDRARGLAGRAAERLGAAGRRAFARGDMAAAVSLLERAAGLLPAGEPDRLELLITLGTALRERGALQEAGDVLAGALAAATGVADSRLEHRARVERAFVGLYVNPDTQDLRRVADAAIPVFERAGDDVGLSKAHGLLAQVHWMHLQVGAMEEELEHGLRHAERAGDERELSLLRTELSRAALVGPRPIEEAFRVCEDILEQSGENRSLRAGVLTMMAGMEATRGRFEEARALGRESEAIYEELGLSLALAMSRMYVGISELIAGDAPAAERVLRHVCAALERMGERGRLSTAAAFLARALCAQRLFDEAERWTEVSEEAASHDDVVSQAVWRGARATVLARRGEKEKALRLAREAVLLADQTDFTNMRADALMELADVFRVAGEPAEAAVALERAAGLYEEKGNVVWAARAAALLRLDSPAPSG